MLHPILDIDIINEAFFPTQSKITLAYKRLAGFIRQSPKDEATKKLLDIADTKLKESPDSFIPDEVIALCKAWSFDPYNVSSYVKAIAFTEKDAKTITKADATSQWPGLLSYMSKT